MLGQAGPTLEKQIARSDPLGDHRPAELNSERKEPMRCELAEGATDPDHSASLRQTEPPGLRPHILPRRPFVSLAWEHGGFKERGPHREGQIPSVVEGSASNQRGRLRPAPTQHPYRKPIPQLRRNLEDRPQAPPRSLGFAYIRSQPKMSC